MSLKDELQHKYNKEVFRGLHNFFETVYKKEDQTKIDITYFEEYKKKSFLESAIKTQKNADILGINLNPCPEWIEDFMVLLDEISEKHDYTRDDVKDE